jgi:tRNA uridine 5-carbamoylmethylation protein Kti12
VTQQLILVRGLPGSGKTTYVKKQMEIGEDLWVCDHYEDDMFFGDEDNYQWNGNLIRFADEWCFSSTVRALHLGVDVVFVSNTFVTNYEMRRYLELVKDISFPNLLIEVHEMPLDDLFPNVHGVPADKIAARRKMWEEIGEWGPRVKVKKVER